MSICVFFCLSVCLSVCLFTFEVPFNVFFAPTSQGRMSNFFFTDSESLGKSNGKKLSHNWTFLFGSGLKSLRKKSYFFGWFCLTKHGGNHASRWIRDLWSKGISLILAYLSTFLSFCVLDDFFRFSKKLGFWVFLVHPTVVSVLLSASVERCFVSRMPDFFGTKWWSHSVEGLLSTGPTPSSLYIHTLTTKKKGWEETRAFKQLNIIVSGDFSFRLF